MVILDCNDNDNNNIVPPVPEVRTKKAKQLKNLITIKINAKSIPEKPVKKK